MRHCSQESLRDNREQQRGCECCLGDKGEEGRGEEVLQEWELSEEYQKRKDGG